jgi:DNA-directed RNA polymerase subunit RPC12/RpoP
MDNTAFLGIVAAFVMGSVLIALIVIYIVFFVRPRIRNAQNSALPSHGAIRCPYCGSVTSRDVRYLGQMVACPQCHSPFRAPRSPADILWGAVTFVVLSVVIAVTVFRGCL